MRVQITLDEDDYAELKALADHQDRTVPGQAGRMLRAGLKLARRMRERNQEEAVPTAREFTALRDPPSLQGDPETHVADPDGVGDVTGSPDA